MRSRFLVICVRSTLDLVVGMPVKVQNYPRSLSDVESNIIPLPLVSLRPCPVRKGCPGFKKAGFKCHSSRHAHGPERRQLELEMQARMDCCARFALDEEVICLENNPMVALESPGNMASFC